MTGKSRGLYETLITKLLDGELRNLAEGNHAVTSTLRNAEAADRVALHLSQVIRRSLSDVADDDRVETSIRVVDALVRELATIIGDDGVLTELPLEPALVLRAIVQRLPDGSHAQISQPLTPLLDTTLLTNAPGEPRVGSQILTEIPSADRIDVVMAFIRRSGIAPFMDALSQFCGRGGRLRVLTTTYTGSTEAAALDLLAKIGAEVRVSYDVSSTRLHAKAWVFRRQSGFSTAYIGSSNLTHSAQVTGLEWNVRLSGARNPGVIENKIDPVFESYWNSDDFVPYEREQFLAAVERSTSGPELLLSPIELRPEPFQERLLEQIAAARAQGHSRNLLVSATGTGKTVMAALDYARLRNQLPRARLLFVAHREEILKQSRLTFCHALRDHSFGELWVGGSRPQRYEHVFGSIQSISAALLSNLDPTHFDVVIIDEFHHAAASSYKALLGHLKPRQLLGLTATPERADGLPIVELFENRIAAELRLWDAIDQHRLCPFVYYGIHDGTDLRSVQWNRGTGYDVASLESLFTQNESWARYVLAQIERRIPDLHGMRALGFCVSVGHARFMEKVFNDAGLRSVAVWADSSKDEREAALADLAARRIHVVFSVDLFNEGVDVPVVDTLLMMRPTDSPVLFLQQLGRGLRRSLEKTFCTVLDFIGFHRKEFRFDRRFQALLGATRNQLVGQIEMGFPFLPAGCHMELDHKASEIVLRNIRESVASKWREKVEELRLLAKRMGAPTLKQFMRETGLTLDDVYVEPRGWAELQTSAGLKPEAADPIEVSLRKGCTRILHVDDAGRTGFYREWLSAESPTLNPGMAVRERRLVRMIVASIADQVLDGETPLEEAVALIWKYPNVRDELRQLFEVLDERPLEHVHRPLKTHPDVPLQIHARYSRLEIFAAFGIGKGGAAVPLWQTGVHWAENAQADLLAFTLDKTSGEFSPTTRYRDYAISPELIHWESQSATKEDSKAGRRYQRHNETGTSIMLFARLNTDERAFWFLGPAQYVSHESEQPMAVTWRLENRLPADLFAAFAAAVA